MFKIFISNATRERILQEEAERKKKTLIYRMLCWNNGSLVEILSDAAMEEYKSHPKKVLDNPSSLYILDIPEKETADIQRKYGVMCVSNETPNVASLIDIDDFFSPNPGEIKYNGWDQVLDNVERLPSNALLITDRYLFCPRKKNDGNGMENVYMILNELLPTEFEGDKYHVTIVFSAEHLDWDLYRDFDNIVDGLNDIIDGFRSPQERKPARNYDIMLEVLGIKKKCGIFRKLHSRRIVSNYYFVEASQQLAAFKGNLTGATQQIIIPLALFTKSGLAGPSSLPMESIDQTIESFQKFNKKNKVMDDSLFYYAINDNSIDSPYIMKNRLFK